MALRLFGVLLFLVLGGCQAAGTAPAPDSVPKPTAAVAPRVEVSPGFELAGSVQGPRGILSTTDRFQKALQPFTEEPLPAQTLFLADEKFIPLKNGPVALTDAKGEFRLKSPLAAGFALMRPASASAPLAAFFRGPSNPILSIASTLVAHKLASDVASHSVSLTALDPAKVAIAITLVQRDLSRGDLSPDFSLSSWPEALDFYTYRKQGEYAQAFNAIMPGSVAPRMSR